MAQQKLNVNKTKAIINGPHTTEDISITIDSQQLDVVDEIKYLDMLTDKKLKEKKNNIKGDCEKYIK